MFLLFVLMDNHLSVLSFARFFLIELYTGKNTFVLQSITINKQYLFDFTTILSNNWVMKNNLKNISDKTCNLIINIFYKKRKDKQNNFLQLLHLIGNIFFSCLLLFV